MGMERTVPRKCDEKWVSRILAAAKKKPATAKLKPFS
jgi:hypothetical protein